MRLKRQPPKEPPVRRTVRVTIMSVEIASRYTVASMQKTLTEHIQKKLEEASKRKGNFLLKQVALDYLSGKIDLDSFYVEIDAYGCEYDISCEFIIYTNIPELAETYATRVKEWKRLWSNYNKWYEENQEEIEKEMVKRAKGITVKARRKKESEKKKVEAEIQKTQKNLDKLYLKLKTYSE